MQVIENGRRVFRCPVQGCTKSSGRKYNIQAHMRLHTQEMPYACPFPGCKMSFKWRSSLVNHERYHGQPGTLSRLIVSPRNLERKQSKNLMLVTTPCTPRDCFAEELSLSPTSKSPVLSPRNFGANAKSDDTFRKTLSCGGYPSMTSSPRIICQEIPDTSYDEEFYCEVKILDSTSRDAFPGLLHCEEATCGRLFSLREHLEAHRKEHIQSFR